MTTPFVFDDPDYVELEAERLHGKPEFFDLLNGSSLGLVSRIVPGSSRSDLVSVYGYPDRLMQWAGTSNSVDSCCRIEQLSEMAREKGHISAYLRLGLAQPNWPISKIIRKANFSAQSNFVGNVVAVDLTQSSDEIFSNYRKNLRYDLRKGGPFAFERSEDFASFHKIYIENMRLVGATENYFFTAPYLSKLGRLPGAELWVAKDSKGLAAGGIFLQQGGMIYYHLGATAERARLASPMKHLLHNRIKALAMSGITRFVLGGGRSGNEDPLFSFKKGFSDLILPVYALRLIFDLEVYISLSGLGQRINDTTRPFPAYRYIEAVPKKGD